LDLFGHQAQEFVVLQLRLVIVASLTRTVQKENQRIGTFRIVPAGYKQTVGKRFTAGTMVDASL
jgi:hypothetical protein